MMGWWIGRGSYGNGGRWRGEGGDSGEIAQAAGLRDGERVEIERQGVAILF